MSSTQLHFNLAYQCELKERGPESFFRAMSTLSLYLDIEAGRETYPQQTPFERLQGLILGAEEYLEEEDTDEEREPDVVHMPPLARRDRDPQAGLPLASFQKRVSKIVQRGSICESCRAAATRPDRFGCWSYIQLPVSIEATRFLLKTWEAGVSRTGKSRLNRRFSAENISSTSENSLVVEGVEPFRDFTLKRAPNRVDLRLFLNYLQGTEELDYQAIAEILADFGAVHWPQLRSISKSLAGYVKAREADVPLAQRPEHPAPGLGPAPMMLQPSAGDLHDVLAWKSFFQICYWSLNLAVPVQLKLIQAD